MLLCLDLNIRSIFCNMYWTLLRVWSLLFTTPIMKLNWLPVSQRITFKICLLIYKALKGLAPIYLSDLLAPRCYKHSLKSCAQELNTRASQCTLSEAVSELVKETLLSDQKLVKLFLSLWYVRGSYLLPHDAIMFSHIFPLEDYWNNCKTHRYLYMRRNGANRAYPGCALVDIWGHEKERLNIFGTWSKIS